MIIFHDGGRKRKSSPGLSHVGEETIRGARGRTMMATKANG
jgi:hypothetical protein